VPLRDMPGRELGGETVVFESDWLASQPFFYSVKTGRASHNINDVIDLANIEFDPEGLNDFLDFGFCVFGRTPLRDVSMLRHTARLLRGPNGLRVELLEDPGVDGLERRSTVDEVLELASAKFNALAAEVPGEIVVPTSGGFDSRFIDVLLQQKDRIRAFTYGTSDRQEQSHEAVKAAYLTRRLGIRQELVPLGWFHRYMSAWDALFGVSTHTHGMYQMEFYDYIASQVDRGSLVLSGACGEWFAGDDPEVRAKSILATVDDVYEMLNYGKMTADSRMSHFASERLGGQALLTDEPRLRAEYLPRVLAMVRVRLTLLSYLVRVPASMGLSPRAPFLDMDLGLRMLTLPERERTNRQWQRDFFARQGVDLESRPWPVDYRNTLNYQAMRRVPLRPLDEVLLSEVVRPDYVRWINRTVGPLGLGWEAYWRLNLTPGFRRTVEFLKRHGVTERRQPAYGAYLTLWPIQALLQRRDQARRAGESA
jgi:hypothetical protein